MPGADAFLLVLKRAWNSGQVKVPPESEVVTFGGGGNPSSISSGMLAKGSLNFFCLHPSRVCCSATNGVEAEGLRISLPVL